MNKAVFFDRDGVLNSAIVKNGKPYSPSSLDEFHIESSAFEVINKLKNLGFLTFIVTNQPEIARGTIKLQVVETMNTLLEKSLGIDRSYICAHDSQDQCGCRKPKPGMLLQAAEEFDLNLSECFLVGDRWKDIESGNSVGCTSFYLDKDYNEPMPSLPYIKITQLAEILQHIGEH